MRHRLLVNLYDSNPVEAELLDYLAGHDRNQRQKIHRFLLLAGFNSVVRKEAQPAAIANALDPDIMRALAAIVGTLHDQPFDGGTVRSPGSEIKNDNKNSRQNIAEERYNDVTSLSKGGKDAESSAQNGVLRDGERDERQKLNPILVPSEEPDDEDEDLDPLERLRRLSESGS